MDVYHWYGDPNEIPSLVSKYDFPWDFLLYLGIAALVSTIATIVLRLRKGATWESLVETRFYEIPEIRVAFGFLRVFFFAIGLVLCCAAARSLSDLRSGAFSQPQLERFILIIAGTVGVFWAKARIGERTALQEIVPSFTTASTNVRWKQGVDRDCLDKLGTDFFPEMVVRGKTGGLRFRLVAIVVQAIVFSALLVRLLTRNALPDYIASLSELLFVPLRVVSYCPVVPAIGAWFLTTFCAFALPFMWKSNPRYRVLSFPRTIVLGIVLTLGLSIGARSVLIEIFPADILAVDVVLKLILVAVNLGFFTRWSIDLRLASNYRKEFERRDSCERQALDDLSGEFSFLSETSSEENSTPLEPVSEKSFVERLARDLPKVEEESFAVRRGLVRDTDEIVAEYERVFCAQVDALIAIRKVERLVKEVARDLKIDPKTVSLWDFRRDFTKIAKGATTPPPKVRLWDEKRFPLIPPSDFRADASIDWLDSSFDYVDYCDECKGRGYIADDDSTTRNATRRPCPKCEGNCALVYKQGIATVWTRRSVVASFPEIPVREYLSDASEETFYEKTFLDDRASVDEENVFPSLVETTLGDRIRDAANRFVRANSQGYLKTLENKYSGRVYRARIRVVGFRIYRVVFDKLRGKFGWYFGDSPGFRFDSLPLSFSAVAAWTIVAPFCSLSSAFVATALWRALG